VRRVQRPSSLGMGPDETSDVVFSVKILLQVKPFQVRKGRECLGEALPDIPVAQRAWCALPPVLKKSVGSLLFRTSDVTCPVESSQVTPPPAHRQRAQVRQLAPGGIPGYAGPRGSQLASWKARRALNSDHSAPLLSPAPLASPALLVSPSHLPPPPCLSPPSHLPPPPCFYPPSHLPPPPCLSSPPSSGSPCAHLHRQEQGSTARLRARAARREGTHGGHRTEHRKGAPKK